MALLYTSNSSKDKLSLTIQTSNTILNNHTKTPDYDLYKTPSSNTFTRLSVTSNFSKKTSVDSQLSSPIFRTLSNKIEDESVFKKWEPKDPLLDAADIAKANNSLLLLLKNDIYPLVTDNTPFEIIDPNDRYDKNIKNSYFPNLVNLKNFLLNIKKQSLPARSALCSKIIAAVREFHEFYAPLPPTSNSLLPPISVSVEPSPTTLMARRNRNNLIVNTFKNLPTPESGNSFRSHSFTSFVDTTTTNSSCISKQPVNLSLPRVYGSIHPSRFVLLEGLFSVSWQFIVPNGPDVLWTGSHLPTASELGPTRYQAPEVALGFESLACKEQDIFAIGTILFEIMTGHSLFVSDDAAMKAYLDINDLEHKQIASSQVSTAPETFINKYVRGRLNEVRMEDKLTRDLMYRMLQWQPLARPIYAKITSHPLFFQLQ